MDFKAVVSAFIAREIAAFRGKWPGSTTVWATLQTVVKYATKMASFLPNLNEDKKQLVLDSAGELFDTVWPMIPTPWYLTLIKSKVTTRARALWIGFADAEIEFIYQEVVKPTLSAPAGDATQGATA